MLFPKKKWRQLKNCYSDTGKTDISTPTGLEFHSAGFFSGLFADRRHLFCHST